MVAAVACIVGDEMLTEGSTMVRVLLSRGCLTGSLRESRYCQPKPGTLDDGWYLFTLQITVTAAA
jgi:hypothetical protein